MKIYETCFKYVKSEVKILSKMTGKAIKNRLSCS